MKNKKWNNCDLEYLKEYAGKISIKELAKILGRTKCSLSVKCGKLNISTFVFAERFEIKCLNCNKLITTTAKQNKKFCNHSCSTIFNNKHKSYVFGKKMLKCSECGIDVEVDKRAGTCSCIVCKEKLNRERYEQRIGLKKCKSCGQVNSKKYTIYCDECRYTYYELYRPSCKFKFNPLSFPEWLDCDLILKHGRYSPSNKGNNLKGVSLDHMYSVKDGFINNISPDIISHPANCKIMVHNENSSKHSNSSISIDELLLRIENFNETYLSSFPTMSLQNS